MNYLPHTVWPGPYILSHVDGERRFVPARLGDDGQWTPLTPAEVEDILSTTAAVVDEALARLPHFCEYTVDGADPHAGNPACGKTATVTIELDADYAEHYCADHAPGDDDSREARS